MDRSPGVRPGRPFGLAFPRGAPPAPRRAPRGRARTTRRPVSPARGVPRLPAAAGLARVSVAFAWRRRRLRIALALAALPLLAGGWLWLRDSPFVAVEHVQVSGLIATPGADSGQIEAALVRAARGMSTLDVNTAGLRAVLAPFAIVRSVRARASFPHGLHVEVLEQPPVAALVAGGARTAVAADGVVLGAGYLSGALPVVSAGRAAALSLPAAGASVRGGSLRQALSVLGAAPAPLAKVVQRAYMGTRGLTIVLRGGLLAYFGDAARAHAKWLSLARVLADPSSAGALYIDVRVPERPAAGFAPGTARPGVAGEAEPSAPTTAAALAASLDAAVAGGAGSTAGAGTGAGGGSTAAGEPASTGSVAAQAGSTSSTSSGLEAAPSTAGSSASSEAQAAAPSAPSAGG